MLFFLNGKKFNVKDIEKDVNSVDEVVESVVLPVNRDDKVLLMVIVVYSHGLYDVLLRSVRDVLYDMSLMPFVLDIKLQTSPLKRSDLGKIVRLMAWSSDVLTAERGL